MKRLLGTIAAAAAISVTALAPASSEPKSPTLLTQIYIGNYGAKWAYDFGDVDVAKGRYYLTDRDSNGLDVIDIAHSRVIEKITGFTGNKGKPEISGPNGVVIIPGTDILYVSDVDSVKVVDLAQHKIVKSIPTHSTGNRTDGGCYDPADKLTLWSLGDDDPPSISFISTESQSIVGHIDMKGADGVEGCTYEPTTKLFYVSIPSTKANPGGEIDTFNPADVAAGHVKIDKVFPLTGCKPTGNVIGPSLKGSPQLAISCDPTDGGKDGDPIFSLIMDTHSGNVTKIAQVGGSDEVAYNAKTGQYFFAARNWYLSGKTNVGPQESVLGIVDATTNTWFANIPTCSPEKNGGCKSGAHSVSSDPTTGRTFVPVGSISSAKVNVYGGR